MPGLLSNDGYIYQCKVVLYYVLSHLLRSDLRECSIELTFRLDRNSDQKISLDFQLRTNEPKLKLYEVKKQHDLYKKRVFSPIITGFCRIYRSLVDDDVEIYLVHATQIRGDSFAAVNQGVGDQSRYDTLKKIIVDMGEVASDVLIESIRVEQLLDSMDQHFTMGDLDLRITKLIEMLLKEYNICEYGVAGMVYDALRTCYENIVSEEADKQRKKVTQGSPTFPLVDNAKVSLDKLLQYEHSIIDVVMQNSLPRPTNRRQVTNEFYTRFNIPQREEEGPL